jgi:hypothetical protein
MHAEMHQATSYVVCAWKHLRFRVAPGVRKWGKLHLDQHDELFGGQSWAGQVVFAVVSACLDQLRMVGNR